MTTQLTPPPSLTVADAKALVAAVMQHWRDVGRTDTPAALAEHPGLAAHKALVLDLAYDEFCLRTEWGENPDPAAFCARMPADYRGSVRVMLQAHDFVEERAGLLAADRSEWPELGEHLDGLHVVGELGRGSFARAYLVFDPQTDRLCVLKLSASRGGEGRTLGRLVHPGITPVFWAREIGGFNAIGMPLLGVVTLEQVRRHVFRGIHRGLPLTAGPLLDAVEADTLTRMVPTGTALVRRAGGYAAGVMAIAAAVADALAYLHGKGARHGDLKPSNVVLGPGGQPYLIDFNLADPGDDSSAIAGTLPYMAPEQLRVLAGHPSPPIDPAKADVFAFGLLVAELLTGQLPLAQRAELSIPAAATHILGQRQPIAWPVGVPVVLSELLGRCLSEVPAARPTAAEVAATLERWLAPTPLKPRHRWQWVTAGLGILLVTAIASVSLPGGSPAPDRGEPKPPAEAPATSRPREPQTAEGLFDRGRDFVRAGELKLAQDNFRQSNVLKRQPRTLAFEAYCAGRNGLYTVSWDLSLAAINSGMATGNVHNNAAIAALQLQLRPEGIEHLNKAILLAPTLPAARYQRAKVLLDYLPMPGNRWALAPNAVGCVADVKMALAGPHHSSELSLLAAQVFAAASCENPQHRSTALKHLGDAAARGVPLSRCLRDTALKGNLGIPAIETAFRETQPSEPSSPPHELHFVEPE